MIKLRQHYIGFRLQGEYIMTQKIIFFDIDGTLLNDDKKLPARTEKAIQQLRDNGHTIVLATGRAPFNFKELRKKLDVTSYISLNGQYVVLNNHVIYKNPLNLNALNELIIFAADQSHPLLYANHEQWLSKMNHNDRLRNIIGSLKVPYEITFEAPPYGESENFQALLFCEADEEEHYQERFDQFHFVRWHDYTVDVLPKGGSKALGIERLIEAAGLKLENAYAFGDGLNDMEMLDYIPNSVAMGNALDPVKDVAKHVTKTVDDDGIVHGLKKLGLLID